MAKPVNPLLAKRDAQLRAEHEQQRQALGEIDMIAHLISAHNELKVGPGRAGFLLAEYIDVKMQIAQMLLDDVGDSHKKGGNGDPEFLHTKKDLALTLKGILGEKNWENYRELFPICREYWNI
jgi:hypothetical protein